MTVERAAPSTKEQITIERTLDASPEDVWEMWTTKEGLESWWGPERFTSTVLVLELRVDGRLEIEMKTEDPEIVAFLKSAGQPATSYERATYTAIAPVTRLAFLDHFDHAPGVEPYDVECAVTFAPVAGGTQLTFVGDAMHDAHWTEMATMGWNQQFDKLAELFKRK
jgi:uncharacterized protein YndB with AHSA1/START domain